MKEAPQCECGNTNFNLEERQELLDKQYIDAKTYFEKYCWTDYLVLYRTYSVAVCSRCFKSYRI